MATSDQLRLLIESHFQNDDARFTTLALQVAAHEAKLGHEQIARGIRRQIDRAKADRAKVIPFRPDLSELILVDSNPEQRLSDLVAPPAVERRLTRILRESRQQDVLRHHGLSNRRKLLLCGPPGCGKTMSASVIAGELGLPLCIIAMDKLMTKFMGETAAKLRQVFESIAENKGVYLFDEFDAIGAERYRDNDVGEIRRVLNAFLQLIERDASESLIVAATNNHSVLDQALFRRFDDIVTYELPSANEIDELLAKHLGHFRGRVATGRIAKAAVGLSHAEVTLAVRDAVKESILDGRKVVSSQALRDALQERREAREQSK